MSTQPRIAPLKSVSSPTAAGSRFGKVSLRLDSVTLDDPSSTQVDNYFPAGSMSSHRDSRSDSEEDLSHPAPGLSIQPKLSPDASGFQPTSDNVIVFEVYTPTDQESEAPAGFAFPRGEDQCYVISEEVSDSRGFGSSPDLLGSENSGYSGDEDDPGKVTTQDNSSRASLLTELAKLHQVIAEQKGEIKGLKMLLTERDATLTELHSSSSETRERGTMTGPLEELKAIPSLTQRVDQLTTACKRYERQNQELRKEIQSCTNDLMELDKAKTKLTSDLKRVSIQADTYESELVKLSEFIDSLLQQSDDELFWSQPDRDPKHLSNYVFSKVEIIGSRYSRMQAAYDRIVEDNTRLRQELEMRVKNSQIQTADHMDLVKQLNTRIKLKDRFIQKLETTLRIYKEKLMELRDDDFHRSLEGDQFGLMAPSHRTENLSHRLKSLVEDLKPYISHDGSPANEPETTNLISKSPQRGEDVGKLSKPNPRGHTEKSFIESDEEVFRPTYMSGSESLNNTMDVVSRKPDTPIATKRFGWKAKQGRRNLHHRTQSQNLFALENYQPVLLHRTGVKDLTLRGRTEDKVKGPVTTPSRSDPLAAKANRGDNPTPKVVKPMSEVQPKSLSLDRKRPAKEPELKSRGKSGVRPTPVK